jgi:hypothetical protein
LECPLLLTTWASGANVALGSGMALRMLNYVQKLYYSAHHATRDLLGAVSPFTAFLVLVIVLHGPARNGAAAIYERYVANLSFWGAAIFIAVYLITAYFSGIAANFFANFVQNILSSTIKYKNGIDYKYWYMQNTQDIEKIYRQVFPDAIFEGGAASMPTDKINASKEYFRKYNYNGYSEAYRQFMKMDIVRATLAYPLIIVTIAYPVDTGTAIGCGQAG